MSRLMSVALTEQAVVERRKTVTRRLGWWETKNGRRILKPGDHLTLCRKVMGRKPGEPLVRLAEVEIVDIRREQLDAITPADVRREGFGLTTELHPADARWFVDFFTHEMRCAPDTEVTRIEWRYLDERAAIAASRPGHVPADIGCEMCGTCLGCDGCADPDNPIDLARGDCEMCGTCAPCIAECRALR